MRLKTFGNMNRKARLGAFLAAATMVGVCTLQAEIIFTDTFLYLEDGMFIAEGGWTTVFNTGSGLNVKAGAGLMYGNRGAGESALEYQYTTPVTAGETIAMNANVDRGNGYIYGMRIFL